MQEYASIFSLVLYSDVLSSHECSIEFLLFYIFFPISLSPTRGDWVFYMERCSTYDVHLVFRVDFPSSSSLKNWVLGFIYIPTLSLGSACTHLFTPDSLLLTFQQPLVAVSWQQESSTLTHTLANTWYPLNFLEPHEHSNFPTALGMTRNSIAIHSLDLLV